jgi:hypothetical protein
LHIYIPSDTTFPFSYGVFIPFTTYMAGIARHCGRIGGVMEDTGVFYGLLLRLGAWALVVA